MNMQPIGASEGLYPSYTPAERAVDAAIHVLGVAASLTAMGALWAVVAMQHAGWPLLSVIIYGLGVIAVFTISAAYHLSPVGPWKARLRRLDHAAIFLKIAGTYTPFAMISVGGWSGAALLAIVWGVAAVGVPLKLFAAESSSRWALWLYLAQGWAMVLAAEPVWSALGGGTLSLLMIGGLLYTIGVVFFISERLPFHNAIWHAFVFAASCFMYAAVFAEFWVA